jgi:hypothetical protein
MMLYFKRRLPSEWALLMVQIRTANHPVRRAPTSDTKLAIIVESYYSLYFLLGLLFIQVV